MFSNIGEKIKVFAIVICSIGMMGSFIAACAIGSQSNSWNDTTGYGFVVLLVGCLASWVGSFFTYGFGQLIVHAKNIDENVRIIKEKLVGTTSSNNAESIITKELMKQWLDEGLISEDEYKKSIRLKDEQLV